METKTLGAWLLGVTIGEGVVLVLAIATQYDTSWESLLGLTMIAQFIFSIISANRLRK